MEAAVITACDSAVWGTPAANGDLPSTPAWPGISTGLIVTTVAALCGFILVFTVLAALGRYISQTALIRMVDEYDETGKQRTVKRASGSAGRAARWRPLPARPARGTGHRRGVGAHLRGGSRPVAGLGTQSDLLRTIETVAAIGLILLAILFAIVVGTVVNTLLHFVRRFVILEGQGVLRPSVRERPLCGNTSKTWR